jgi:hypothetical protein
VNKLIVCMLFGAMALGSASGAQSGDMISFATGGYADALRSNAVMPVRDPPPQDSMVSRREWIGFQNREFTLMDRYKTGEIDVAEYTRANPEVAAFGTGGFADALLPPDVFKKIDTNHDGRISRQEFIRYQLMIFDKMNASRTHKRLLGPAQFFATGGTPAD